MADPYSPRNAQYLQEADREIGFLGLDPLPLGSPELPLNLESASTSCTSSAEGSLALCNKEVSGDSSSFYLQSGEPGDISAYENISDAEPDVEQKDEDGPSQSQGNFKDFEHSENLGNSDNLENLGKSENSEIYGDCGEERICPNTPVEKDSGFMTEGNAISGGEQTSATIDDSSGEEGDDDSGLDDSAVAEEEKGVSCFPKLS